MARGRLMQGSFLGGEMSPLLEGRMDLERYGQSAKELTNAIVLKHGPVRRRPGTQEIAAVKDSTKYTRLVRFPGDPGNGYRPHDWWIEFGHLYARFYNGDSRLTYSGNPVEIITPWTADDLPDLQSAPLMWKQSATFRWLLLAHPARHPKYLDFTFQDDSRPDLFFTLVDYNFADGPYAYDNTSAVTLTPSATTGSITITASSGIFEAGHVGSVWRIGYPTGAPTAYGWARITAFTDSTHVTATVGRAMPATTASTSWSEGEWSDVRGWPATVTVHEQRAVWGRSVKNPRTAWATKTASGVITDYQDFGPGAGLASDAYSFALTGTRYIRWLHGSDGVLRVGGVNRVFQLQTTNGAVIAPNNLPKELVQSNYGACRVPPIQAHNALLFVTDDFQHVREVVYEFATQSYVSADVSEAAEHLLTPTITEVSFQQAPDPIMWAIRADGVLLGLTYDRPNNIVAWHRHTTDGLWKSVCVGRYAASLTATPENRTLVIVKRGSTQYVERLVPGLLVDCAVRYSGSAVSTISGLTHLNGLTVDIVSRASSRYIAYPQQVVASGEVTGLSPTVTLADVGLHFDSKVVTPRPEMRLYTGSSQGVNKRVLLASVRLFETVGCTVNGKMIDFAVADETAFDDGVGLFTGDKEVDLEGWDRDANVTVEQTQPLPFTLVAVMAVVQAVED